MKAHGFSFPFPFLSPSLSLFFDDKTKQNREKLLLAIFIFHLTFLFQMETSQLIRFMFSCFLFLIFFGEIASFSTLNVQKRSWIIEFHHNIPNDVAKSFGQRYGLTSRGPVVSERFSLHSNVNKLF